MVVNHPPTGFGFCPDGRIPARAVGHSVARQDILTRHERVFLAEHPHDDVFKAENLQRLAGFPETFAHRLFDRLDPARRTRREHLGRFLRISRKINAEIALVPPVGGHLQSRPDRLFILALPENARRTDGANKNQQKYKLFHSSFSPKFPNLTRPPAKSFAPPPAHGKNTRKIKSAGIVVNLCGVIVNVCGAPVNLCGVIVNRCGAVVILGGVNVNGARPIVICGGAIVNRCGVTVIHGGAIVNGNRALVIDGGIKVNRST